MSNTRGACIEYQGAIFGALRHAAGFYSSQPKEQRQEPSRAARHGQLDVLQRHVLHGPRSLHPEARRLRS